MKTIVEFGRPQLSGGVSGQFVCESTVKAADLATQLWHVLSARQGSTPEKKTWLVRRNLPRVTRWSSDRDFWVTVSVLDGVPRGSYAAIADKQSGAK